MNPNSVNPNIVPVPDPTAILAAADPKTLSKVLGIALAAQWFVPWGLGGLGGGAVMSWSVMSNFAVLWSLLAGLGLGALGFLPADKVKDGWVLLGATGAAFLGLISLQTFPALVSPFFAFFAVFGLVAVAFGLFLWATKGFSQLAWIVTLSGAAAMALSMLMPMGNTVGIVFMFSVFGFEFLNIVQRIVVFLCYLLFLGVGAAVVYFVVLKKDQAEAAWVRLLAWAALAIQPLVITLLGLLGIFSSFWWLMDAVHGLVLYGAYATLIIVCGQKVLEAVLDGRFSDLLKG